MTNPSWALVNHIAKKKATKMLAGRMSQIVSGPIGTTCFVAATFGPPTISLIKFIYKETKKRRIRKFY